MTYRFTKELDTSLGKIEKRQAKVISSEIELDQKVQIWLHYNLIKIKLICLITLKYASRRFFRIYITFVIIAALFTSNVKLFGVQIGGRDGRLFGPFLDIIMLGKSAGTIGKSNLPFIFNLFNQEVAHASILWTIGPEIKYYFFIPFLCLTMRLFKRFSLILNFLSYYLIYINEYVMFLPRSPRIEIIRNDNYLYLSRSFTFFFSGSLVAFFYYYTFENQFKKVLEFIKKSDFIKKVLTVLLFVLYFIFIYFGNTSALFEFYILQNNTFVNLIKHYRIREIEPAYYFAIILLLMLISAPNKFTDLFAKNKILVSFGKYSFGMYLLHKYVVTQVIKRLTGLIFSQLEMMIIMVFSAYLCGVIFYHLIENPLMKVANKVNFILEQYFFQDVIQQLNEPENTQSTTLNI